MLTASNKFIGRAGLTDEWSLPRVLQGVDWPTVWADSQFCESALFISEEDWDESTGMEWVSARDLAGEN